MLRLRLRKDAALALVFALAILVAGIATGSVAVLWGGIVLVALTAWAGVYRSPAQDTRMHQRQYPLVPLRLVCGRSYGCTKGLHHSGPCFIDQDREVG